MVGGGKSCVCVCAFLNDVKKVYICVHLLLTLIVMSIYCSCRFVTTSLTVCLFFHDRCIPENVFNHFHGQMPNAENVHAHILGQTGIMEVF